MPIKLEIPLDVSGVEDFKPEPVKVALLDKRGGVTSQVVKLDREGKGVATFSFREKPRAALQVVVGPADASDTEIAGLQTITFDLPTHNWKVDDVVKHPAVLISPFYWHWWLAWCRTFVIRGRVLCPDGKPVPGATVCAYDVDWWWWWWTKQQVGCDTTDSTGSFVIKFRWCCGWWPWWWWKWRVWEIDPIIVDQILPVLQREPRISRIPELSHRPDLDVFEGLIGQGTLIPRETKSIDPTQLDALRDRVLAVLPAAPELERLRIWPWRPWHPWWDCTPDILFRVTQNCHGANVVIVNEGYGATRWDIPTSLNVTLAANQQACCIDPTPTPEGNCINVTHACSFPVSTIGGNLSAPATPVGFQNPGAFSTTGDRPFAEVVRVRGDFGTLATADYYELEWFDPSDVTWKSLPSGTFGGFTRLFFGPQLPAGPVGTWAVPFNVATIDGRDVIESRLHFQAGNGPGSWEVVAPGSRWWMDNKDVLGDWLTSNSTFSNGTYQLRVKSWQLSGATLINPQILDQCGTDPPVPHALVLTTDNRAVAGGPFDSHGHPCGTGTVHTCTTEPDTGFLSVRIVRPDGTEIPIGACGNVPVGPDDDLVIDFVAHDPAGHLALYTLQATYGVNMAVNLLALPGTLSPSPIPPGWAPPAAQIGPNYGQARLQGALSPIWHGGALRLRVHARHTAQQPGAFPETCCYQLELRAHKRTIVSCADSIWGHTNYSEYSFMVVV